MVKSYVFPSQEVQFVGMGKDLYESNTKANELFSPVRWTQTIINIIGDGMTEFVECGPGQVLTGLIGKIQKSL